jgi:hypothetical protein
MKHTILLVILLIGPAFGFAKDKNLIINDDKVQLIITEDMNEGRLKKIQKELLETKNIKISWSGIIVNSHNRMKKITFEVDCQDGYSGKEVLIINDLHEVGFIRNYSAKPGDSAEPPFKLGQLEEKAPNFKL